MLFSEEKGIEEVFMIKTEAIDFFGALVKEKGGKSVVNGRVWFQDGNRWYFYSPEGEQAVLREKLSSLCETLAEFYRTCVYYQKFDEVIEYQEFIRLLREAKRELH